METNVSVCEKVKEFSNAILITRVNGYIKNYRRGNRKINAISHLQQNFGKVQQIIEVIRYRATAK